MLRYAAILIFGALALSAGAGPVYKCTNADGKTYYSGQPCPKDDAAERLRVQRPSNAEQAADAGAQGKTLDEKIAEAEDPVRKAQLELQKKQCDLARTQLQRYEDAPYLVERMDDGTERRLSEEETAAEKAGLRKKLETECR